MRSKPTMYYILDGAARITAENEGDPTQGHMILTLSNGRTAEGRVNSVYDELDRETNKSFGWTVTVVDRPNSDYALHVDLAHVITFEFADRPLRA